MLRVSALPRAREKAFETKEVEDYVTALLKRFERAASLRGLSVPAAAVTGVLLSYQLSKHGRRNRTD